VVDLADTIYQQYPSSDVHTFTPSLKASHDGADGVFFSEYQPLSVVHPWMRLMAAMFTTHVRMVNVGLSYEGRDILGLRVGVSPHLSQDSTDPRKTIIISGGSHAREWISVSTVTYIAWSLINTYGKSPGITKLLQEFDFVFIPTLNPDGYVYTWEHDRLWRKNRQQTNIKFCQGLDLDRGFGFRWDGDPTETNPCSESYPGEQAFQAVESHRLAEWARNETENNGVSLIGFLDLHSYSQQVLYPYSYSCTADPPSLENLEELGMGLAKAIRISSGEEYSVASACEGAVPYALGGGVSRMETGGGSAIDWFYHEMHVRYSYQIKLRDTGSYGFLLPKENIMPTGEEAFNAVKYFGDFLLGNKGIETDLLHELHKELPLEIASEQPKFDPESELVLEEEETMYDNEEVNWELRRRRRR
jgi:extracellular matrix protein 14